MNRLSNEDRTRVVVCLVEGNSERHSTRGRPFGQWEITVTFPNPDKIAAEVRTTTNKRDAQRSYDMLVKYSREPIGKYCGASVRLKCDGKTIAEHKP